MNLEIQVEVATIDCAFDRGDDLDWVVSGAPPFQTINFKILGPNLFTGNQCFQQYDRLSQRASIRNQNSKR